MTSLRATVVSPDADSAARRLKRQADYFFGSDRRRRSQVTDFVRFLQTFGDVAAVGGLLRDLFLAGNREFSSDVDFVVSSYRSGLNAALLNLGGKPNRFGGYGFNLGHWRVDVWELQTTWAAKEGHVRVQSLEDVVHTTFFDWDAILYLPKTRELIHSERYFEKLESRVLDLNLEHNPNPLGNAVRALRYAVRWDAALGPALAAHVRGQIEEAGWCAFLDAERRSFRTERLAPFDVALLRSCLDAAIDAGRPATIHWPPHQPRLPHLHEEHAAGCCLHKEQAIPSHTAGRRLSALNRQRRRNRVVSDLQGRLAELG